MSAFKAPTGTHDLLPPESSRAEACVARFATLARRGGFGLLNSPMFEDAEVFRRSSGESSEVVSKEMYEFEDKAGRHLALRPEGTASVVRAFIEHRPQVPWKTWYLSPIFRYERPQAGRYRQHHQLGVEVIGTEDPDVDVEVIVLGHDYLSALGLTRFSLGVNSLGDDACMPAYRLALVMYLESHASELCDEHRTRFRENPLRVLDCKKPECVRVRQRAPRFSDRWCAPCRQHFARVTEGLDAGGIAWHQDDFLVRGLDYYTRTTFEFAAESLDAAQNVVVGGGRYDKLSAMLGGPDVGGIGFGSGLERVLLACEAEGALGDVFVTPDVFVVDVVGGRRARDVTRQLRSAGYVAERAYDDRSMKAQLRLADRSEARLAAIFGPDEERDGTVTLRVLRDDDAGKQETVGLDTLEDAISEWLA
ncbi:MAG: histidine--tRNA ligase [Acidimicrobiales bacterium]